MCTPRKKLAMTRSTADLPSSAIRFAAQGIEKTARAPRLTDCVVAMSTSIGCSSVPERLLTSRIAARASSASIRTPSVHRRFRIPSPVSSRVALSPSMAIGSMAPPGLGGARWAGAKRLSYM